MSSAPQTAVHAEDALFSLVPVGSQPPKRATDDDAGSRSHGFLASVVANESVTSTWDCAAHEAAAGSFPHFACSTANSYVPLMSPDGLKSVTSDSDLRAPPPPPRTACVGQPSPLLFLGTGGNARVPVPDGDAPIATREQLAAAIAALPMLPPPLDALPPPLAGPPQPHDDDSDDDEW